MRVQIFAPSGGFLETELGGKVPTITSVSRLAKRKIYPMTLWTEHSQNSGSASEQAHKARAQSGTQKEWVRPCFPILLT